MELSSKTKTGQLVVRHTESKARWIEVAPIFYEMESDGSLKPLSNEEAVKAPQSAIRMIRFSPKRFRLQPGESQVLRVRAFTPSSTEDGVYRVHLKFTPDDPEDSPDNKNKGAIRYQLQARVALAVPIYFKKGNPESKFEITNLKIEEDSNKKAQLSLTLTQSGKGMARGDISVFQSASKDMDKKNRSLVGKVAGLASYVPSRSVKIPLSDDFSPLSAENDKKLEVEFTPAANEKEVLTQAVLLSPQASK